MLLFVIALPTDVFTVLLCWFCAAPKAARRRGMLLGCHVPPDAQDSPAVQALCTRAKRVWRRYNLGNLALGVLTPVPALWNTALGTVLWMTWLLIYVAGAAAWQLYTLRAMYRLKMQNGWVDEGTRRVVLVDTAAAAAAGKNVPGWKWHLAFLAAAGAAALCLPLWGQSGARAVNAALLASVLLQSAAAMLLHRWLQYRANTVYSRDPAVNLAANTQLRRGWALGLLALDFAATAGGLWLLWRAASPGGVTLWTLCVFAAADLLGVGLMLAAVFGAKRQNDALLAADAAPLFVDDDEHWQYGVYYDPADTRLLVPGRISETSYSFNLGRPAGRVLAGGLAVLVAGCVVWFYSAMLPMVNVQVRFSWDGAAGSVCAGGYRCGFTAEKLRGAELLETWPPEGFVRTNGGAADDYMVGHYTGSKSGRCMLFCTPDTLPVLKLTLEGTTVYLNSRDPAQTRQWAALLSGGT